MIPLGQQGLQCIFRVTKNNKFIVPSGIFMQRVSSSAVKIDALSGKRFENSKD